MHKFCQLQINKLNLNVNLGWRRMERHQSQDVFLDITIRFKSVPRAVENDELEYTVCYATLIQYLRENMATREYRLIEHLAGDIYNFTQEFLMQLRIDVSSTLIALTKHPRIDGLSQGVTFLYGDKQ